MTPSLAELIDRIPVPLGPATYAEPFDPHSLLKMPANALVNVGYLVVAWVWLRRVSRWTVDDPRRAGLGGFEAFAAMTAAYGPIQLWRIVTQSHLAGVVDQWATLPFFSVLGGWNLDRRGSGAHGWRWTPAAVTLSAFSYALVLWMPNGFEALLSLHIAFVVATSLEALREDGWRSWRPFMAGALCCAGFVGLKQADLALGALAPFQRLTGHFWSKVCDFLQIHYALCFVAEGYLVRRAPVVARAW